MHKHLWHSLSVFDVESYTVYAYFVKRLLLKGGSLFTLIFHVCGVGRGVRRPSHVLCGICHTMCMAVVVHIVRQPSNRYAFTIKRIDFCLKRDRLMIQTACF